MASTRPSRALGISDASPHKAARAAASASTESGFPVRRRVCRLGRSASKEQCLWVELYEGVDELRQAMAGFVATYNTQWLIGRHGHRTPKEAYQDATTTAAA